MFIAKGLASSLNISSYMFVMIAMKERMIDYIVYYESSLRDEIKIYLLMLIVNIIVLSETFIYS